MKRVLSPLHDIIVSFIEECQRCQFRSREFRKGAQRQSVETKENEIEDESNE